LKTILLVEFDDEMNVDLVEPLVRSRFDLVTKKVKVAMPGTNERLAGKRGRPSLGDLSFEDPASNGLCPGLDQGGHLRARHELRLRPRIF